MNEPERGIPPVWITLASAPDWLSCLFGLVDPHLKRKLVMAVRRNRIHHKVVNLRSSKHLDGVLGDQSVADIGVYPSFGYISDWDLAPIDFERGTVGSLEHGANGVEFPCIMLEWDGVEKWAGERPPSEKLSATPLADILPANKGGAPVKHDWEKFWIEVAIWAGQNGLDRKEDQQRLRDFMKAETANWPSEPDETTVKKRLGQLFKQVEARNMVRRG